MKNLKNIIIINYLLNIYIISKQNSNDYQYKIQSFDNNQNNSVIMNSIHKKKFIKNINDKDIYCLIEG